MFGTKFDVVCGSAIKFGFVSEIVVFGGCWSFDFNVKRNIVFFVLGFFVKRQLFLHIVGFLRIQMRPNLVCFEVFVV